MDTLSGAVERITYYNSENGYTVLRLRPDIKRMGMLHWKPFRKIHINSKETSTA
jgi:hypothetical protein